MNVKECPSCSKSLLEKANFCGKCKTQVKCLICKEEIGLEDLCCEACGADIKRRNENNDGALNKIRYDGKTFDAEFTNTVGKDITETFGRIFMANQQRLIKSTLKQDDDIVLLENEDLISEAEEVENDEVNEDKLDSNNLENDLNKNKNLKESSKTQYLHIEDIKIKMDFSEKDWIIVYAFYNSEKGKSVFNKAGVRDMYKKDRFSESRMKKFYINWNRAYKLCFSLQKEGEIRFNDDGLKYVNELLTGKKVSNSSKTILKTIKSKDGKTSKTVTSKPKKGYNVIDLGINEDKRQELRLFFEDKKPKSQEDIVVVLSYWLEKIGEIDGFSENEIYTAIQIVGQRTPSALGQVLRNLKNNGKINLNSDSKKYYFNHVGEDYVKFNLPKVK